MIRAFVLGVTLVVFGLHVAGAQPRPKGRIDIRGDDATGAKVMLDHKPAGVAPIVIEVKPGRHLVELRKPGRAPFSVWLEVSSGGVSMIVPSLALIPGAGGRGKCPAGMAYVPGATFQMGSPNNVGDSDEHPRHQVTLSPYCIDKTEVTVKAYAACVKAGRCTPAGATVNFKDITEADKKFWGPMCNANRRDRQTHPVNCVDWSQAVAYCRWAHKRLPTEAEWEFAAEGSDGRTYPWGNDAPTSRRLNGCGKECAALAKRLGANWPTLYSDDDGWESTAPVGSFPAGASPFGVLDMAGNVWEWTGDWYGPYAADPLVDPTGTSTGEGRSNRGGSWGSSDAGDSRTAYRNFVRPQHRYVFGGFRCARE